MSLIGKKFGELTVIKATSKRYKGRSIIWLCRCSCGSFIEVVTYVLKWPIRSTRSCGCVRKPNDISGLKFERLTAIKDTGKRKGGDVIWRCRCDCGKFVEVRASSLRCDRTKSCGCLQKDILVSRALPSGEAAFNIIYSSYRSNAKQRDRSFELNKAQFRKLTKGNCTYCGVTPTSIKAEGNGSYIYNGIDRIDNAKGYTEENCCTCCANCNGMKECLSVEEFLSHTKRICDHQAED